MSSGPAFFVDPVKGKDAGNGTAEKPWQTVQFAVEQLRPGDTLYLREGTYYENVAIRVSGTEKKPITIRCYPGEQATLSGAIRDFVENPEKSWMAMKGNRGEYRSTKQYRNQRDVVGAFGDSMIGLQTYYYLKDLRAKNEQWLWENPEKRQETDVKPVYCGPGLWYDRGSGHIYARLAHTHLPKVANYRGETDPRKLPLVIAPFRSVPLLLDGASWIRIEDLIIKGGGYDTVILDLCESVTLQNVTVRCGTYGMRLLRSRHVHLSHCGLYGSVPPWTYRGDTSLRSYPGRPHRDITRLSTHSVLVPGAGREYSVFAFPVNDDWEIEHCELTDAHDGPYLGGINLHFHHNMIHNMQDDGIYLSPMYPRYSPRRAELYLYQNYFGKCLTALAFGGPEKSTKDRIWIYRNVVDLQEAVATGRPSLRSKEGGFSYGKVMGDHGSPPWSEMRIYHNTFAMKGPARFADMGTLNALSAERPRLLFNNIFWHGSRLPGLRGPGVSQGQSNGNLYWSPGVEKARAEKWFDRYRRSPAFQESRKQYPAGFTSHSLLAEPFLRNVSQSDYGLTKKSPAIDAAVAIPKDWPDPYRTVDAEKPDIGAMLFQGKWESVGRKRP